MSLHNKGDLNDKEVWKGRDEMVARKLAVVVEEGISRWLLNNEVYDAQSDGAGHVWWSWTVRGWACAKPASEQRASKKRVWYMGQVLLVARLGVGTTLKP